MKTKMNFRNLAAVLITTVIVASSMQVDAQRRNDSKTVREDKNEQPTAREKYEQKQRSENRDDRSDHQYNHSQKSDRTARLRDNEEIRERKSKFDPDDRYDFRKHDSHKYNRKYEKPNFHKHESEWRNDDHRRMYYHHPKYGKVYRKFDHNPHVFRHQHGRYYYYDGHFCEFRNGLGYVIIDAPLFTVFGELPFACKRIRIDGRIYYRYNGLYFESHPHGYRLVPSPYKVHLSFNF